VSFDFHSQNKPVCFYSLKSRFHCHINLGRRLSILLQLAEALIIDLKLNREPLIGLERKAKEQEFWVFSQEIMGSEIRTLEERRAYLGQVYLSSAYATLICWYANADVK
jgi:hypothetical protein